MSLLPFPHDFKSKVCINTTQVNRILKVIYTVITHTAESAKLCVHVCLLLCLRALQGYMETS